MDLKGRFDSWQDAFVAWKASAGYSTSVEDVLMNMQLLHECKDSCDNHFKSRNRSDGNIITSSMISESRHIVDDDLTAAIDEEALHGLLQEMDDRILKYAFKMNADISDVLGCFENSGLCDTVQVSSANCRPLGIEEDVSHSEHTYDAEWKDAYEERKAAWKKKRKPGGR